MSGVYHVLCAQYLNIPIMVRLKPYSQTDTLALLIPIKAGFLLSHNILLGRLIL